MSPVACKAIVGQMPSSLLAGLLYMGSGLGLTGVVLRQTIPIYDILSSLSWRQRANLVGAIISGGVAAPLFLAYGIRFGTASEVSLLLNFEAVATTLLAWMIFHEHVGYRVWIGKLFIVGASILVVFTGSHDVQLSIPGLSVLAACILWGIDNNLTRELESIPASLLACIKGWSAGIFNVLPVQKPGHGISGIRSARHRGTQLRSESSFFHSCPEGNRVGENQHMVRIRTIHRHHPRHHSSWRAPTRRILGGGADNAFGDVLPLWGIAPAPPPA